MPFFPKLQKFVQSLNKEFDFIEETRKALLQQAAKQIAQLSTEKESIKLTFICTHNSRRSMFGQIWAKTAAVWYGIDNIETYSGGTEATAFNERVVAALQRVGFKVESKGETINPLYNIYFDDAQVPILGYSKLYNAQENPQQDFIAIMTCDHADENCPFIPGALKRMPITYNDPKEADDTERETEIYDERCLQIATEMFYIMSLIK